MDLMLPRVFRRSNVGLVDEVTTQTYDYLLIRTL